MNLFIQYKTTKSILLRQMFVSPYCSFVSLVGTRTDVNAQRVRFYSEKLLLIIKQTFTPKNSGSHEPRSSQVTVQLTYLSQRHHSILSFAHTLFQTGTIAELISEQTVRTLWTCLAWAGVSLRSVSVPYLSVPYTRWQKSVGQSWG